MSKFQDKHGLYHHIPNPKPDSSSNAPVFTAAVLSLKKRLGADVTQDAQNAVRTILTDDYYGNYAYAYKQEQDPLSHDNWKGVVALNYMAGYKMRVKFQPRSHLRPDNLALWIYVTLDQRKLKLLGLPFLAFWSLATFISMTRRYKTRNEQKRARAGNKQMTYFLCTSMELDKIFNVCTFLVKKNSWFGSWYMVFHRYYNEGHSPAPEHPCIKLSKAIKHGQS